MIPQIEQHLEIAERLHPTILKKILAYTDYCDANGDDDDKEYKKLEDELHALTGKDMSEYNLWEWWEEEGAEVLAFRIALPPPIKTASITKEDLETILNILTTFIKPKDDSFKETYAFYLNDKYYPDFLSLNFEKYKPELFERQKDKNGNYFEYTSQEILEIIW